MSGDGLQVKLCGLTTPEAIDAVAHSAAAFAGFIFFPESPRHLEPEQAQSLASKLPRQIKRVAVTVDADDTQLDHILQHFKPDYLQLHGNETPERVQAVKARYHLPVIKAISVRSQEDIASAKPYEAVADLLLFDAKIDGLLPGGNGVAFDWTLLDNAHFSRPWMLSGGLNAANLTEAINVTGARMVDASSGLEKSPGVKDPVRIAEFMAVAAKL